MTRLCFRIVGVVWVTGVLGCSGGGASENSQDTSQNTTGLGGVAESMETDELVDQATDEPSEANTPDTSVGALSPNILFIISDDQGLDASAQYSFSQDVPNTPVLDSLASEGLVFDNAWATPACATTRATILTGKHGFDSGVVQVPSVLSTDNDTVFNVMAQLPQTSHYQSAVFGKWHLGNASDSHVTHPSSVGVPFFSGTSGNITDYFDWDLVTNGEISSVSTYATEALTSNAMNWVTQQGSQPWFMWLAYHAPHSPFHLPESHLLRRDLDGTDIDEKKREYFLAAIEAMDMEIGRLLDSMPTSVRENTLIIYVGDNGTPRTVIDRDFVVASHGKSSLYEGGVRVPFVVSGKSVMRKGERESALINTTDLFSTILTLTSGTDISGLYDVPESSHDFSGLLEGDSHSSREYNYTEYESDSVEGFAVRNRDYKLIVNSDGTQELYDLTQNITEATNLSSDAFFQGTIEALLLAAENIRNPSVNSEETGAAIDITGVILEKNNRSCTAYVDDYVASARDVNRNIDFDGALSVSVQGDRCVLQANAIPNHDFNDGTNTFPNAVSAQSLRIEIPVNPQFSNEVTPLSLAYDNGILLNGVKVDVLAAGCFGVGNGKIGCGDPDQPWRYDPAFEDSDFLVDSHNAHSQPDGTYHYHGHPNALFYHDVDIASPVIGFAADGFPIFGSYIEINGTVRKVKSSYQLKEGARPAGEGNPGGTYNGTFRDDYEYIEGAGDLDECNGMSINDEYSYYLTDHFPYFMACFKGVVDESFRK